MKVTMMSKAADLERISVGSDLFSNLEFYGAVLGRKGLIARQGEFRISKLGLIIDLIKALNIKEEMTAKLTASIIEAWRLDLPESTLDEKRDEMGHIMCSIDAIRSAIRWSKKHTGPLTAVRLDIAVIFALPLMPSDLYSEKVPLVHALLAEIMDYLAALVENAAEQQVMAIQAASLAP